MTKRKFWGWGYDNYEVDPATIEQFKTMIKMSFGVKELQKIEPPKLSDLELRAPRFDLPESLKSYCTDDNLDRASHSYGKSYRDVWRGLHGQFDNPPDYIAYPTSEEQMSVVWNRKMKVKVSSPLI